MEKLYVLAGKAQTGKDSVAKIIQNNYSNKKVLIYSCTMYLKKYVSYIYGWDGREETKPREHLQTLGQIIKDKYPNFFIDRMNEDIKFLANYYDLIIITGVRLKEELKFLKNTFNAILIKVEKAYSHNNLTMKQQNDITETDVDNYQNYDYIIHNDESLELLSKEVSRIIKEEIK